MFRIFDTAWVVLPVQLLHGITFGLYWSTGNQFIQQIAPAGLTTSMISVFSGVNSAGGFTGAVLGGFVYKKFGGDSLFLGIACINLFMGVTFTTLKMQHERRQAVTYTLLENVNGDGL
jgi:predicted MFS family arabinose efflux permease